MLYESLLPPSSVSLARTSLCAGLVICDAVRHDAGLAGGAPRGHGLMRATSTKRHRLAGYACRRPAPDGEPCPTGVVWAEPLDVEVRARVLYALARRGAERLSRASAPPPGCADALRAEIAAARADRRAARGRTAGERRLLRAGAAPWREAAAELDRLERARVLAEFATDEVVEAAELFRSGRMPWARLAPLAHRFDALALADRRVLVGVVVARVVASHAHGVTHVEVVLAEPFAPPRNASPRACAPNARERATLAPIATEPSLLDGLLW